MQYKEDIDNSMTIDPHSEETWIKKISEPAS